MMLHAIVNPALRATLRRFGRRALLLGVATGLALGLTAAALALLVAGWLDLVWELAPELRLGGRSRVARIVLRF